MSWISGELTVNLRPFLHGLIYVGAALFWYAAFYASFHSPNTPPGIDEECKRAASIIEGIGCKFTLDLDDPEPQWVSDWDGEE